MSDKLTKEQRSMHEKAVDDAETIQTNLYHLLKFISDQKMSAHYYGPLVDALKAVNDFRSSVDATIKWDGQK